MDFGSAMFFTDYSMAPGELAPALEARGFAGAFGKWRLRPGAIPQPSR